MAVGRATEQKAALTSQGHVPSPGALELTKGYAKVLETLDLPVPRVYPYDSTEQSTVFSGCVWEVFISNNPLALSFGERNSKADSTTQWKIHQVLESDQIGFKFQP